MQKQRLELDWVGKDEISRIEPRILLFDDSKSYGTKDPQNILIHGDNLLALKALEGDYAGKIKCIFADPPYNTGAAFAQYDDGIEHSQWLSLIRDRLLILKKLLSKDGSLWITIDDNECHYLKIVCDELFGRHNFVGSIVWEKDKGRRSDTAISTAHDYILVYAKDAASWKKVRNLLPRTEDQIKRYRNPDDDSRGPWLQGDNGTAKSSSEGSRFPVTLPSGRVVTPPPSRGWSFSKETLETARSEGRVYFGADGDGMPIIKRYLSEVQDGVVPRTWWPADECGHNQEAKRDHLNKLLSDVEPFATPKPERLLQRILQIATSAGDLVLDSFAGSGTTGATATKMMRNWIMVELGEHCFTHIIPRLKKVIDGEDPYGITDSVQWKGGGGFKFCRLAPSLLLKDNRGNWVINLKYDAVQLAHAVCKHEGFQFWPDQKQYWKQGYSSERDFIFVTTQFLAAEHLEKIASQMRPDETLLICTKAYRVPNKKYPNITIKKIPQMLLGRCEFGRDDYSLNIQEPIQEEIEMDGV